MAESLAVVVREGYSRVEGDLSEEAITLIAYARASTDLSPDERSRRLAPIVAAYRAGPRQLWGPVLLDLLAPAILVRLKRLGARPPVMDQEEIRQQFLVELLHLAATVPLPVYGRWPKTTLMSRANQAVRRWLEREGRRQDQQISWETLEEEGQ
jgi:hypothetical protein